MNTLILTVGLPRSGKSTWAREYVSNRPNAVIVNPDSVRLALHGQRYSAIAEDFVWATVKLMVRHNFMVGHSTVILDATNTTRKARDVWKSPKPMEPAFHPGLGWKVLYKVFDTHKENCIDRARCSNMPDLIEVIERMYAQWEPLGPQDKLLEEDK